MPNALSRTQTSRTDDVLIHSRTCVKTAVGKLEVREIPVPVPAPGEAVLRTRLATICGSDIHFLHDFPMPRDADHLAMGHEAVGEVAALGAGVIGFSEGERVVASCVVGCGSCENCQRGHLSACTAIGKIPGVTNTLAGCQGEYFRVPYAMVNMRRVPDELSDEQAIFAGDIMSTGFGAVERGDVGVGDTVAVFAQGPVGLCATAAARARGAGLVIAVEGIAERAKLARRLGANVVVAPESAREAIMDLTDGRGVDVAVEALGRQETFRAAVEVTRLDGTISSVGVYAGHESLELPLTPAFYQRRLVTTLCPGGNDRLGRLFRALQFGQVDLTSLFTHRMALDQVVEAYDVFQHRRDGAIKIALVP